MALRNTAERIRIFLGTEPRTEIRRRVLEMSVTRHTDMAVDFIPMLGREWEYSTAGIKVGTAYSLRRWMIPAFCKWQGRAIYLEDDQLALGDVWDLWTQPEQRARAKDDVCFCTYQPDKFSDQPCPQASVMVLDCAKAKEHWGFHIDKILPHLIQHDTQEDYADFMHATWLRPAAPVQIPIFWNHLNHYEEGMTCLLHYTKESTRPWRAPDQPLAKLWKMELSIAIAAEVVTQDMLKEALLDRSVQEDRRRYGLHSDYVRFLLDPKVRRELEKELGYVSANSRAYQDARAAARARHTGGAGPLGPVQPSSSGG